MNLATLPRKDKPNLQRSRLLAPAQPLEPGARLRVELVAEAAGRCARLRRRLEVAEERLRRELRHLAAGGAEDGAVGRDEQHSLPLAVLGRESLEQRVGIGCEADRERTELRILTRAGITAVPAVVVLGFWILIQLISGVGSIATTSDTGGVAYMAHVGGFVAGLVLVKLMATRRASVI